MDKAIEKAKEKPARKAYTKAKRLGLYIHIPFCVHKCPYCDFCSTHFHDKELRARYIKALCKEIAYYGPRYSKAIAVESVYFGGGTPSLLEIDELQQIMNQLHESFRILVKAEITIESNPATLDTKKLKAYRKMGIKRLSIGAQSFDNSVLATLGRIHDVDDVRAVYKAAAKAGFRNINLDLMFGVPGQTFASWVDTVRTALFIQPQHISLYSLEFMEDTWFWKWREEGKMIETSPEDDRLMYEYALKMMEEKGYMQYEISNVARQKRAICKHNLRYWELREYLGFGASAHSFMRNVRYSNVDIVEDYIHALERQDIEQDLFIGTTNAYGTNAIDFYYKNSYRDNVSEYIFTGLRKNEGIKFANFRQRFDKELWELYDEQCHREFSEFVRDGFAMEDEKGIRLTVKGMNISNRIMSLFV